jgi:hypothetical protein
MDERPQVLHSTSNKDVVTTSFYNDAQLLSEGENEN